MAKNKKSFVLYADLIHTVEQLPDEAAGRLLKHILQYVNDKDPITDELVVKLVFEPIKQQLKRDLNKWEGMVEKRREAGRAGGLKRASNAKQTKQVLEVAKQSQANQAVTVNDTVNVIVKKSKEERAEIFKRKIIDYSKGIGSMKTHKAAYPDEMLKEFFSYWTESNEGAKKMRFELAKNQPFQISRRLATWKKNQKPMTGPKLQQSRTEINNASIDKLLEQQKQNRKQ